MKAKPIDPLALSRLVALVQQIVNDSGDPVGFDAQAWTLDWLSHPCPALGNACPADYMHTEEDRALVETLVLRMQSGAYS